jgi:hypothetical protein
MADEPRIRLRGGPQGGRVLRLPAGGPLPPVICAPEPPQITVGSYLPAPARTWADRLLRRPAATPVLPEPVFETATYRRTHEVTGDGLAVYRYVERRGSSGSPGGS